MGMVCLLNKFEYNRCRLAVPASKMRHLRPNLLLIIWLLAISLPLPAPVAAAPARLTPTGTPPPPTTTPMPPMPAEVKAIVDRMSPAEKVGQLFLVTFEGDDASAESAIAILVRDYRVGGVVLQPANSNFRNLPVPAPLVSGTQSLQVAPPTLSTPLQIARLASELQSLAFSPARPMTATFNASSGPILGTALTPTAPVSATVATTPTLSSPAPDPQTDLAPDAAVTGTGIPLLVGLDWAGDDSSFFSGTGGFTPLPSEMAIGATWSPALAEKVGQVAGQELKAAGISLLLGPTLDVLDVPRPGNQGDLDTRTFGGDPFWVGQMGQAFIRGVQWGSKGGLATAAKHFPGQGGSDRRPEEEVAAVQKSLQQLRQIELAPFAAVTNGSDLSAPGITPALMTSHIRYRGFQGNIRQLTPPISLAPQLQDLMALKEFADWRAAGGVLISDALGVPAVRRYYDPQLAKFPHRQAAQDAFMAGNDLLLLGRFALTDNWTDQFVATKETILYFQNKYESDSEFRQRVDAAVERIIQLKLRTFGKNWDPAALSPDPGSLASQVGQGVQVSQAAARAGLTLIYPGRDELADRMPSAPLADENLLIFTEARPVSDCDTCAARPAVSVTALQDIILRLYGPSATGQVQPRHIDSLTFTDLNRLLTAPPGLAVDVESAISGAKWIVFAQLDSNPLEHPDSAALRNFLTKRSDSLRDKRLVVMALNAPYYLDTTDISKLTAYFGVYAKTAPFLETAVRALFREFVPIGAPPVSVTGINYDLINQLEPGTGQVIALGPTGPPQDANGDTSSIQVGSLLPLETGVILDRKGHPVPDGTPVEFRLRYPAEALDLAPKVETTLGGKARTMVVLDRPGELWITVQAGEAKDSARIVLKVGGDTPGSIATVLPSPTVEPSVTPTAASTSTSTPMPTPTATTTPVALVLPAFPKPRVTWPSLLFGLLGVLISSATAFFVCQRVMLAAHREHKTALIRSAEAGLWAILLAWGGYILFSVGWLPGATELQTAGNVWAAGAITFVAGLLSLVWIGADTGRWFRGPSEGRDK